MQGRISKKNCSKSSKILFLLAGLTLLKVFLFDFFYLLLRIHRSPNAAAHGLETALTEGKIRRACTEPKTRTMLEFARGLKSRAAALLEHLCL